MEVPQKNGSIKTIQLFSPRAQKYMGVFLLGVVLFFSFFSFFGANYYREKFNPRIFGSDFSIIQILVGAGSGAVSLMFTSFLTAVVGAVVYSFKNKTKKSSAVITAGVASLFLTLIFVVGTYIAIKAYNNHYQYSDVGELILEEYFGFLLATLVGSVGGTYLTVYIGSKFFKPED